MGNRMPVPKWGRLTGWWTPKGSSLSPQILGWTVTWLFATTTAAFFYTRSWPLNFGAPAYRRIISFLSHIDIPVRSSRIYRFGEGFFKIFYYMPGQFGSRSNSPPVGGTFEQNLSKPIYATVAGTLYTWALSQSINKRARHSLSHSMLWNVRFNCILDCASTASLTFWLGLFYTVE